MGSEPETMGRIIEEHKIFMGMFTYVIRLGSHQNFIKIEKKLKIQKYFPYSCVFVGITRTGRVASAITR